MDRESLEQQILSTDALVIGGGLAGTWAALAAARQGAAVVLADKGYCGTSGVAAAGGPGFWWIPPDQREAAIERREASSHAGISDWDWMRRIMAETWEQLPSLEGYYDFHTQADGRKYYRGVRGPEYLRALRNKCLDAGVRILDQSPALGLLQHADGSIAGATLWQRQFGRRLAVRSAGVVVATGGCAFMSGLLGSQTNTGDGYLMAAEAGARLSGMEFSSLHCVAQAHTSMTRTMIYSFADYFDAEGRDLRIGFGPNVDRRLAAALLKGPVYCSLHRVPEDIRRDLSSISPNIAQAFARTGVDPYRDRFEITLHAEGTIRGIGGIRIAGPQCQTDVPGLFAAGDAATRELVAGAGGGGGAINASWALSSGCWSGRAIANLAKRHGRRDKEAATDIGRTGRVPSGKDGIGAKAVIASVQKEMFPYDKNIFRSGANLRQSLGNLENTWQVVTTGLAEPNLQKAREAVAITATARWCYSAALAREESRGQHLRLDFPEQDPRFDGRLLVGGLDRVWTRLERERA